ncbi:MAG TPA: acyl-ACP--UDP-N-acetylglucosamine O-acyltransferase [Dongiaceae bacterium]|nr:acyl-ACP--UDP-N-acetylglucosamine O-acyltransferase [Dongiaceae bacterium]
MIHPTAIIHPKAKLDTTAQVGPFAVIDEGVELGAHCIVGPHVYLTGITKIGSHNRFHAGCVIGDAPQDLKYKGEPTRTRIGDHNVFREQTTVHRSTTADGETIVGSNNFFMANSHIAHNCLVGDHVIFANGALLGGHVQVQDRVFISGNCAVHQFCRIGTLAIMQGGACASQDVPPFTVAQHGLNIICGLNIIGLRRAGIPSAERLELKRLYHLLFREGKNLRAAREEAEKNFTSPAAKTMLEFVASAKRGVCSDTSLREHNTRED